MNAVLAVSMANGRMHKAGHWVLGASVLLFSFLPLCAFADAVLYVSPEKGEYIMGQTFEVKVYADTGGTLINAAEGDLAFNTEALEVENISTDGSIMTSWSTKPEFSNEDGTIRFAGWTKNNYSGVDGLLVTITFKAIHNMVGNARLAAGAILAADGQESNIITSMRSGVFTIKPQEAPVNALPEDSAPRASDTSASSSADTAKVPAPAWDDYPDAVSIGDHIVLRGNTEPNAHVSIYLAHGTESETQTQLLSASDGSFTYVSDAPTVEGVYHIRASVQTDDGRQSVPSDTIDISAAQTGLAASAIFGAGLLFETIPFLALIVIAGLGAAYIFHRHQVAKMHYGRHTMFDAQE